jgi:DNA modification methylase
MKVTKDNWRDIDVNIDSLWIIGPRATGGKRSNVYHGNFAPQIPNHLIRRYTEEGDTVMDLFMGSGTTLFECELLNRNFIGFDINPEMIDFVSDRMADCQTIKYSIFNCDVTDGEKVKKCVGKHFEDSKKGKVDFLIAHPPYLDIIKFTDQPCDLSQISDLDKFIDKFVEAMGNGLTHLKAKKMFAVVVGDIYRESEVIPLGFYLMDAIKKNFKCKLKGIVIKDMVGNRAKLGLQALWRYRTLKSDNFLFKHEYIFVFKKN